MINWENSVAISTLEPSTELTTRLPAPLVLTASASGVPDVVVAVNDWLFVPSGSSMTAVTTAELPTQVAVPPETTFAVVGGLLRL